MAATEGIAFAPLPAAFLAVLDSPEAKAMIGKSGAGFGAGFTRLKRQPVSDSGDYGRGDEGRHPPICLGRR